MYVEMEVPFHTFLSSTLDRDEYSPTDPSIHWLWGWVGSKPSLDTMAKKSVSERNQTSHPVHSLATILTELYKILTF